MVGGVVSTTVTVWLHSAWLVHASTAVQVRVAVKVLPQVALVTVPTMLTTGAAPHTSVAVGASNVQAVPHSTVLLGTQVMVGGVWSFTVMVCDYIGTTAR